MQGTYTKGQTVVLLAIYKAFFKYTLPLSLCTSDVNKKVRDSVDNIIDQQRGVARTLLAKTTPLQLHAGFARGGCGVSMLGNGSGSLAEQYAWIADNMSSAYPQHNMPNDDALNVYRRRQRRSVFYPYSSFANKQVAFFIFRTKLADKKPDDPSDSSSVPSRHHDHFADLARLLLAYRACV